MRTSELQGKSFESEFRIQEKYTKASFEASWLIAKAKKPFNIGEELVLPTAIKMTEIVYGKNVADEMRNIPLSNNTVQTTRRISAISGNISEHLIQRIKAGSKFVIQLDETTDKTDTTNLLINFR